jgi:hypothetical protein
VARRTTPTLRWTGEGHREALVNVPDETGWMVGGDLQRMHVIVSARLTVYAIIFMPESVGFLAVRFAPTNWS